MKLCACSVAVAAFAFLAADVAAAPIYTFETFDVPGSVFPLPAAINDSGQVVGYYIDASGNGHGFVKDGASYTFPLVFGVFASTPTGINDAGQITGYYVGEDQLIHGFVKDGDTYTSFDGPGARITYTAGLNDIGQIVGTYIDDTVHGFLKEGDAYSQIQYPGAFQTEAQGINDDGTVVGFFIDQSFARHGFVKRGGDYTELDFLGIAQGINDAGLIVGNGLGGIGYVTDGVHKALVNVPGSPFGTFPTGINDRGQIVGSFVDEHLRRHGFIATPTDAWDWEPPSPPPPPVPEPPWTLMAGSGVAMWLARAWRRRLVASSSLNRPST